ncbi:ShlB/FhaC/HecB family hemolysin secretion/activation protein [Symbiopectobacterium purcellii]|uniref:ShlB/FhaC/HecB family hemolysin secretion/activation protein n=1 Tax=Symbiopectobacterium purcellii TaxID=2871826 RepID=A0ABX9AQ75_9ENTR|nr:ShlB/FhaC/HecB family hemolysin secretion/activation protein [Symbiopectobacterium purcellii]QZN96496.1 ShlB/FhaC/HecB family hemolysin secretion/activation protein [Symbiopectobacterium purcellii]
MRVSSLFSPAFLSPTLLSLCIGIGLNTSAASAAPSAGQLAQPTYAPVQQRDSGRITLPATTGLHAPQGSEQLYVVPSGLIVEGGYPELAQETARIASTLKDKRVSAALLFAAARELEAAYAKAGYLLTRVTLPPQQINDGAPLRVIITDGFIEKIDASAFPITARRRMESMLAPLVGEKRLTRSMLERRLLLAGDTPGVMLKSTLQPGSQPGSTVLIVDGRYNPITGSVSLDNGQSDELGKYSLGVGGELNNITGLGDQLYMRLNGYPRGDDPIMDSEPRSRQFALGLVVPLGTDGFWLNLEGVDSRTKPTSETAVTTRDRYHRFSTRVGYHWLRARDINTSTLMALDIQNEQQNLQLNSLDIPFTQDKLRVLRLTQSFDVTTDYASRFSSSLTASFGIDGLGARKGNADLPMSKDGAKPDFQKLELTMNYSQGLADGKVQLSLAGLAQTAFNNVLPSSEQVAMGGSSWISAFDSGTMSGDSALVGRAEVGLPQPLGAFSWAPTFGNALMPYAFGSLGTVGLSKPTALEQKEVHGSAYGVGLRLSTSQIASPNSAMVSVEYARGKQSGEPDDDRVNLRVLTFF